MEFMLVAFKKTKSKLKELNRKLLGQNINFKHKTYAEQNIRISLSMLSHHKCSYNLQYLIDILNRFVTLLYELYRFMINCCL